MLAVSSDIPLSSLLVVYNQVGALLMNLFEDIIACNALLNTVDGTEKSLEQMVIRLSTEQFHPLIFS